jgi:penicillin-insensitive murein endopeptidase
MGFYSNGCIRGAAELPEDGIGYQTMYVSRHRHFGHPELVQTVQDLARKLDQEGSALLMGDMGQPRGGPMPYGHASHQLGLDADLWFWTHPEQRMRKLTRNERDTLPMISMLSSSGRVDPKRFGKEQVLKLRLAASDPKVERIFVNPAIKLHLCQMLPASELSWLHKLRPWPGHDAHFHIRLACPQNSSQCRSQDPVSPGDGCAELRAQPTPRPGRKLPPEPLPDECQKVLRE